MAKKKGKYAAVMAGLQPRPLAPEELSYQQQVDAAKAEHADKSAPELAAEYALRRAKYEALKAAASAYYVGVEALEQLLSASEEARAAGWGAYGANPNAIRLPDGGTIRVDDEPQGRVVDKEAFRLWCMAPSHLCMTCGEREADGPHRDSPADLDPGKHAFKPGGGYERQLQLWPTTMNSVAKERLLAGEPQPDGVEVNRYRKVVYTPAKRPQPEAETTDISSFVEVE